MFKRSSIALLSLTSVVLLTAATDSPRPNGKLSAVDIANKNVEARGGLEAWRSVRAMSLVGKMGVGGNQRAALTAPVLDKKGKEPEPAARPADETFLPFVMDLQRPRKMRFELQFKGQTAVQVFDGANGWKLRPFLNRRVVEPYTNEEMKLAAQESDLDGPLVDYSVKGTTIELAGMEKVEDRETYKLKLTMKNGTAVHVWIDAQTFLEQKIEGQPRRLDGVDHPVEVYFRDYRLVNGLRIPFLLETKVLPIAHTSLGVSDPPVPVEKIEVSQAVINPKFDEARFAKP